MSHGWRAKWLDPEKRKEPAMTSEIDNRPMTVKHGKTVWRDVVATKVTAESILDLLSPQDSPVLDSLVRIEAKLDTIMALLMPPSTGAGMP